jgi:hypothetical protein
MSAETENTPFDWRKDPCYGGYLRAENMAKFPPEKLAPYIGQVVAWFPDGSGIWGGDPSMGALWDRIKASGDDPSLYFYEYLEPEGII